MTRSELVQVIADQNPHLRISEVTRVVTVLFEEIVRHLATGGRVELRGFGVFSARERRARLGRNPRTGAPVEVLPKRAVHFKPAKRRKRTAAPARRKVP